MKKILLLFLALWPFSGIIQGGITWGTPVAVSTSSNNASDPHTIIDSNGNATAIWVENSVIISSYLPEGGSWSSPVTLSGATSTALTPRLGIDGSGNVTAIWLENTQIESAILTNGTWGPETSPISATGASNPSLAVDNSGDAVGVWVRNGFIESSTRKSGTWSGATAISPANSSNPSVAISSFGTALSAWQTIISGSDVIYTNFLTISTNTWAGAKSVFVASPAFLHNYPKVSLDSQGNSCLAWFRYNLVDGTAYENVELLISTLTQGAAAWSLSQILGTPGIINPADLTIKMKVDQDGDTVVVWNNSLDGETYNIYTSQKLFGSQSFSDPALTNFSLYSLGLDLTVSGDVGLMTYMQWDGVSNILIQSQETDCNNPIIQNWTAFNPFSTGSGNAYPSCSMSVTGTSSVTGMTYNAVAVWLNYNGTNIAVNGATGTEAALAPPTNVSATQNSTNFGVYTDYYNTITWTATTDSSVMLYNLYRNGVYFASTIASTLSFVDHNQLQGAATTYGVATYTFDNRQSSITSYTMP